MANSKRLNITVPQKDYEEWTEAVEEDRVAPSLSELIRNSVNLRLDENLTQGGDSPQTPVQSAPSEEVLGSLERLERTLADVQERIQRVESDSRTKSLPDFVDWRQLVLQTLPSTDDAPDVNPSPENYGVSTEDYATRLGLDGQEAYALLDRVSKQTGMVSSIEGKGTTYWWVDQ